MGIECGCGLDNACFHTYRPRSSFHPNEDIEFIYGAGGTRDKYSDFKMPKGFRIVYKDCLYIIERRFLFFFFWFRPLFINGVANPSFIELDDAKKFIVENVIENKIKDNKVYYEL